MAIDQHKHRERERKKKNKIERSIKSKERADIYAYTLTSAHKSF